MNKILAVCGVIALVIIVGILMYGLFHIVYATIMTYLFVIKIVNALLVLIGLFILFGILIKK